MSRGQKKERTLAKELGALLSKILMPDLRARAQMPSVAEALRHRFEHEQADERTAESYEVWVEHLVEQVGAAWILSCVFVRTLEDRDLVPRRRLAGDGAADSEHYFNELAPSLDARDYLLTVFKELSRFPSTETLLGPKGNPAWRLAPSGSATQTLLDFFRERKDDGSLRWTFGVAADVSDGRSDGSSTRFLGDLYQDLSESVRERYALLQTPDFVERFILGLTLDPAIQEFGLEEVRLIDPTCGSGHFLLGAYDRLFDARLAAKPGFDRREHALEALKQIYGVDVNPYAVAIARFRLTLAFLEKAGLSRLADAPPLPNNLALADSLLYGARGVTRDFAEVATEKKEWVKEWGDALFSLEDPQQAVEVLSRTYHAVVGNPPYITCKDDRLRERYRRIYSSCHKQYALGAPFTERFFQLAVPQGWVGLINANSFMKREFGKSLVEEVLPRLDLTYVVNTSGAYIPGHGTPTVILIGRNRPPVGDVVRTVLGKRGEPSAPEEPEFGLVWSAIASHFDEVGYECDYISVAETRRETLAVHPWVLAGGGAAELKLAMERAGACRLRDLVEQIGRTTVCGEDDAWILDPIVAARVGLRESCIPLVVGEGVRDWSIDPSVVVVYPYVVLGGAPVAPESAVPRYLWPFRSLLEGRTVFGKTLRERGEPWYAHLEHYVDKIRTPLSIAFAFVSTHNHFVLDRGGKVFNRSAPVIKLREGASEEEHLALLGYLNSSAGCFWMKQAFFDKGNRGEGGGLTAERWEKFFEFDGTKLKGFPVPASSERVTSLARLLDAAGQRWGKLEPVRILRGEARPTRGTLQAVEVERAVLEGKIRWLQEELDWEVYGQFGLPTALCENLPASLDIVPQRALGSRPADYLYAEEVTKGNESPRYFSLCSLPAAEAILTTPLDDLDRRRLALIAGSRGLGLIETPTYKRTYREGHRPWDARPAVREWALDLLEEAVRSNGGLTKSSLRQFSVAVWNGMEAGLAGLLGEGPESLVQLALGRSVPFAHAMRFTVEGERKYAIWQRTWDLQRCQDAGEKVGDIPVPPKYDQKDYRDPIYWRLRGKLDLAKERFISYPGAERDDDKSPLIGWAGWDHLQRAQALAALYQERKAQDAWEKDRLQPLLAGLLELVPWLKQWHNTSDEDPAKDHAGDAYATFVEAEARSLGFTLDDLRAWRPPERTAKGRSKGAPGSAPSKKASASTASASSAGAPAQSELPDVLIASGPNNPESPPPPPKPRRKKKSKEAAE